MLLPYEKQYWLLFKLVKAFCLVLDVSKLYSSLTKDMRHL